MPIIVSTSHTCSARQDGCNNINLKDCWSVLDTLSNMKGYASNDNFDATQGGLIMSFTMSLLLLLDGGIYVSDENVHTFDIENLE